MREISSARRILQGSDGGIDGWARRLRKNMSLQRGPGFKSILAGQDKLRIRQRERGARIEDIGKVAPAWMVFTNARERPGNRCLVPLQKGYPSLWPAF